MSTATPSAKTKSDEYPLPEGWLKAFSDEHKRYYFIHKPTRSTSWIDPREANWKPKSWEECTKPEDVPYGWEIATDPLIGTYFIDHINKQTLLDDPRSDKHKRQVDEIKSFVKSGAIDAVEKNLTKKLQHLQIVEENVLKKEGDGDVSASELENAVRLRAETEELKTEMEALKADIESMKRLAERLEETETSQLERQQQIQREIETVQAELAKEVAAKEELQKELKTMQQKFDIPEEAQADFGTFDDDVSTVSSIESSPTESSINKYLPLFDTIPRRRTGDEVASDFIYPTIKGESVTRVERELTLLTLKKKLKTERDLVQELIDVKKIAIQVNDETSLHSKPEWIAQINQYAARSKTIRAKINKKRDKNVDALTFREKMLFYTTQGVVDGGGVEGGENGENQQQGGERSRKSSAVPPV
ncbi:hypothetical protein SmJEL517_g00192 [Synchytrium microbalum]|uniref:WW domain-containing protein n=1 Tax=Synchytrium microbalum TaxID=1806994 RepID=A0A507CFU4_9FUNG|nr:uncharacterized protein SmJEL517_g00192 [Synchytrium microbalum]TPX38361.1 hypothetical protein SmJEL517_g00192 [Synchytrium microbalum]